MTMSTDDQGKAAAAIKLAQQLQRPLLIKKLIPEVATKFNIEQLLGVDELKVYPDDAGLGTSTWVLYPPVMCQAESEMRPLSACFCSCWMQASNPCVTG